MIAILFTVALVIYAAVRVAGGEQGGSR